MRLILSVVGCLLVLPGVAMAQSIGIAAAVNQSALGTPPSAKPKTLVIGDKVIYNEKIATDSKGLLQILLADGSSFTVGPNSSMAIDSFVYDPNAGTAKVAATLGKGVFRFIGGRASKAAGGVTLDTPVGTVGIQGGISNLDFSGAVPFHVDMIYGDAVTLTNGTTVIGNLYHSGYSIVIDASGKVTEEKTPPAWAAAFQAAMAGNNKGGKVSGTDVASSGGAGSSTPGSNPNTVNDPTTGLNPVSPVPTWAQIDNSSLASVNARYDGEYSATVTGSHHDHDYSYAITDALFQLDYSFARNQGTATFGRPGSDSLRHPEFSVGVKPDAATGPATFSADVSHSRLGRGTWGSVDLNGLFLDTDGDIANGVAGTFDATISQRHRGTVDIDGAFAGNYTGPVPTKGWGGSE